MPGRIGTECSGRLAQLEAQLFTQKYLLQVVREKHVTKPSTPASAKAALSSIMDQDDLDEKEASLLELSHTLHARSVPLKAAPSSSCYFLATSATAKSGSRPILDSGASMSFATTDKKLTNPRSHKTKIATAAGQTPFTKATGKYKTTNTSAPIYLTASSAPTFTQNLVSIGQLAQNTTFCSRRMAVTYWTPPAHNPPQASSGPAIKTTSTDWRNTYSRYLQKRTKMKRSYQCRKWPLA